MTHVFGQGDHEPLDLLRGTGELGAQVLALGGDAGRAGVEVALASHVAAERDEDGGAQRVLLGAKERGDQRCRGRCAGRRPCAAPRDAQAGAQQDLVGLGQAELPWHAGVLDRAERRGPRAARMAADCT